LPRFYNHRFKSQRCENRRDREIVMLVATAAANQPAADNSAPQPFRSAEEAWFSTMRSLVARRDIRTSPACEPRPCRPEDILKCLDQLYRRRRIDLYHARVLRLWGERQAAPNPARPREGCDWTVWREALDRLEWPLRAKGFVVS
jgi:hypothetical protein